MNAECEVLAVGAELLRGEIINGNAGWLGERLAAAGWSVTRSVVVTDSVPQISQAVQEAATRVPVVILTGGLGPTQDDLTREGIADAAGVQLVRDADLEAELVARMTARGRAVPARNLRQADIPEGGRALPNPEGTAPGLRVDVAGCVVYALPGVPLEMRAMLEACVLPELAELVPQARPLVSVTVHTAGLWESEVAERLAELEARARELGQPEVAFLASGGQTRVVLTGRSPEALTPWVDEVVKLLAAAVVAVQDGIGRDPSCLPRAVVELLLNRGQSVAVAESLTAGQVCAWLGDVPGVSAVLRGGVVAYASDVKSTVLGVAAVAAHGAVDPETAREMAVGIRALLGADWGLATTGVAGPDPMEGHVAGTVHVAVVGPGVSQVRSLRLPGDRARVRMHAAVAVLDLLRRVLQESDPDASGPA